MDSQLSGSLLVDDPSIVHVSDNKIGSDQVTDGAANRITMDALFRDSKNESEGSLQDLHSGDAISKLLDSAMANSTTNENSNQASNSCDDISANNLLNPGKTGQFVYSIEFLMSLKDSPDIPNFEGKLPDKSFWKINKKGQNQNLNEFKSNRKNSFTNKKNHHQNESWERKHSSNVFSKNPDIDSLSPDKISQLLGESNEEVIPEWDSADLGSDHFDNLGMGQTVQDFEKWKSHMKLEERKKNGEVFDENVENDIAAEKAGNEVDSFFSFVKPKPADSKIRSSSVSSTSSKTPKLSSSDISGRSSKFSSFFAPTKEVSSPTIPLNKTKSHDPDTLKSQSDRPQVQPSIAQFQQFQQNQHQLDQQQEHLTQQQHQIEEQQKHPFPPNSPGQHAPPIFSRFFNPAIPVNENTPRNKVTNPPPGLTQAPSETAKRSQPSNQADSFFMSLLNKKESDGDSSSTKSPKNPLNAMFAKPNPQPSNPTNHDKPSEVSNPSDKLTHQQSQQQVQPQQPQPQQQQQQQQHYQQNPTVQQGNGGQPNQPLPPWMKQFQNGMPPMPPPPHMQFPPQNFQGNVSFQGVPLGNNIHSNQRQGPPPPGMFPNGMFPNGMVPPPRGMQLPPHQFINGNPNGPYPPPQFMGVPPGLPPQLQKQNARGPGPNLPQQHNSQ